MVPPGGHAPTPAFPVVPFTSPMASSSWSIFSALGALVQPVQGFDLLFSSVTDELGEIEICGKPGRLC